MDYDDAQLAMNARLAISSVDVQATGGIPGSPDVWPTDDRSSVNDIKAQLSGSLILLLDGNFAHIPMSRGFTEKKAPDRVLGINLGLDGGSSKVIWLNCTEASQKIDKVWLGALVPEATAQAGFAHGTLINGSFAWGSGSYVTATTLQCEVGCNLGGTRCRAMSE